MKSHSLRKKLLLVAMCLSSIVFAQTPAVSPRKGVLRVKLQPEVAAKIGVHPRKVAANGSLKVGISSLDVAVQKVKGIQMRRVFPYSERFEQQRKEFGLDRWYEIVFDDTVNPLEAKQMFKNVPGIQLVENITPMKFIEGEGKFTPVSAEQKMFLNSPRPAAVADMPFNDPQLSSQWHYHNDGSMGGSVAGADINLFKAWQLATGSKDVLVAIVDGGVDYTHVDLADNMWVNEAELNGTKGKDDDGNGFIDDIYGYNFVTNSGEIYPHAHGTHVAGTVAAVNNNNIGVCGVAGGNGQGGVRMMSCQVFDSRSGSGEGDFAAALVYAAEMGASIAQCSWGWGTPGYYEQAVLDAIDYFTKYGGGDKLNGGLCIFAAGNNGETGDYYPGCYPTVLCVASMTCDKTAASYTNYGEWVDVSAPGGLLDYDTKQGVLSTLPDNNYGYNEGTSMACPHVSGIAALVLSKYGKADLPNETLRQQLVTSVHDIYGVNPNYAGKLGSGYIDAYKAMQMSDGQAPEPVADFTLLPSQDNIVIEWTIPAASDNNVNHHTVYYSTSAFTAESDLSKLNSVSVDTKFLSSGDKMTYELGGLESRTTYYLAMKSVDRWGNAAALSPVKSATTNAGPKMELDKKSLKIVVDASASTVGSDQFTISNTDEGLLKWKSSARTVSVKPASLAKRPMPGELSAFNGRLSVEPYDRKSIVSADFVAEDFPKEIKYSDGINFAYIGEMDTELPNSEALWFRVDPKAYPDGFNLTHLNIGGKNGRNPRILIYDGKGSINKGALLQEVTYSYFVYGMDIALPEQLYFAPGESFWVIVHFEKGNINPLGMSMAEDARYENCSYMSNDLGESWTLLREALKGSKFEDMSDRAVWNITAKSKNPDWSEVISLDPAQGSVKAFENQLVNVVNDGQKLVNGDYKFNIRLHTNETANPEQVIPVNFTVKGNKPELKTAKVVDFGNLLVGQSKTLTIEVVNNGFGGFYGGQWGHDIYGHKLSSTSDQFVPTDYVKGGFPARSTSSMEVTYKPTKAGSHTGKITVNDKDNLSYEFVVHGVAVDPAEIAINPSEIEVGTLQVGAGSVEKTFAISNNGSYPLEFVLPRFSDEKIEGMGKTTHKFGYRFISNLNGAEEFEYDGVPSLVNATDIASQFTDNNVWSEAIDLGFDFPYYGKSYSKVYISSYGGIAMNPGQFCMVPTADATCVGGMGFISAYGGAQLMMTPESKVEYAKQDGKFVVNFSNVMAVVYAQDYTPVSFHMSLSPNGDVEIFYDDYEPMNVFEEGANLFVGVNDIDVVDPFTITDSYIANNPRFVDEENWTEEGDRFNQICSGTAIKILAPDRYFIQSIAPASGIVSPGSTTTVTAVLKATPDMYAGNVLNQLVLLSNDPNHTTSYVNFKADIQGDVLQPVFELANPVSTFGKVFRTAEALLPITVKNVGNAVLEVYSVYLDSDNMTLLTPTSFNIAPGNSKDIMVQMPTEKEGVVENTIHISYAGGVCHQAITGEVIGVPEATLNFTEINETLASGSVMNKTLTVTNTGNEPLIYSITPNEFIGMPVASADENSSIVYEYSSSVDNANVAYDWIDIETNGLGAQNNVTYYMKHDFVAVDLPFEFPFYGKLYNKMYIYNTGFISFTERPDDKIWPEPPAELPSQQTMYTNMLAPYWGMHSMDQTRTAGTFHYVTEDRAVISFMEYGNSMNRGVCFQVVMNRDGSFRFQYKGAFEEALIFNMFGVAGIANEGGTEGIGLPSRYVKFGEAVEFYPVKTDKIANGDSRNLDLRILANRMAGNYSSNLVMHTNVPGSEKIELPIQLNITGKPDAVFPESITAEWVSGTASGPVTGSAELPWKLINNGTAEYTVTDIRMAGNPMTDWGSEAFMLFYYGEHEGWFPGEVEIGWGQYWEGTPITVGKAPVEFILALADNMTVADYDLQVEIDVEGVEGISTVVVPVHCSITDVPVMTFDKEEIRVSNVASDYEGEAEMTITNTGDYTLRYSVVLDPSGQGAEVEGEDDYDPGIMAPRMLSAEAQQNFAANLQQAEAPVATDMKMMAEEEVNPYDLPAEFVYNSSLYYPAMPDNKTAYQYGVGNTYAEYKAATYFVAPETGFNLTHIYTAASIGTLDGAEIQFQVIKGENVNEGAVLGGGTIKLDKQPNPQQGRFMVVALDKPIYLNPGEKFFIAAIYPKGVEYPAYLCVKEEGYVSNRYMGWQEGYGWFDAAALFKDQYGSLGYILTGIEQTPGSPWISMLTTELEGELGVGESKTIQVKLSAATAPMDKDNKAVLVINSNDPEQEEVNYPIYLDKNVAPVVTVPSTPLYVKEGETKTIDVEVIDQEGESFTVEVRDELGAATLQNLVIEQGVGVASVALAPNYDMAGENKFVLVATDESGNQSATVYNYFVENVNRAPEVIEMGKMEVAKGSASAVVEYASLFTDPDEDELTYSVSVSKQGIVEVYDAAGSILLYGKEFGEVEVTVTATDEAGAKAENKFVVEVVKEVGIDSTELEGAVSVYPNPVVDKAHVTCRFDAAAEITYRLFNANGAVVYMDTASDNGEVHVIDMEGFASGVYYLEITSEGETVTVAVMKR